MLLEPCAIVLYVDNLAITSNFYRDLLERIPEEASATFHSFKLSNGMNLGLKARHAIIPPAEQKNGSGELVFALDNHQKVDALFAQWQAKKLNIIAPPTQLPYGYTFVALDPDGNRLRIVSLEKTL